MGIKHIIKKFDPRGQHIENHLLYPVKPTVLSKQWWSHYAGVGVSYVVCPGMESLYTGATTSALGSLGILVFICFTSA